MKKQALLSVLAVGVLACGGLMAGCKNNGNSENTYSQFDTFVSSCKENDTLFSSSTVQGVNTNFYLNNFSRKGTSNAYINDDQNYIYLTSMGMNFIENNYSYLKGLGKNLNYSGLDKEMKTLNKKYDTLKQESENLKNVETSADYDIYNGYFSRYKTATADFTVQVYQTATSLGDFLFKDAKIFNQTKQINSRFFYEYQNLNILDDFCQFFLVSCEGQVLDNTLYTYTTTQLKTFMSDFVTKYQGGSSMYISEKYYNVSLALDNEREIFDKVAQKFSMYKYVVNYNSSLSAYENDEKEISIYYDQFNRYLGKNSTSSSGVVDNKYLDSFLNYLTTEDLSGKTITFNNVEGFSFVDESDKTIEGRVVLKAGQTLKFKVVALNPDEIFTVNLVVDQETKELTCDRNGYYTISSSAPNIEISIVKAE